MGTIEEAVREAIRNKIDDADIEVAGEGGHFNISVTSKAFEGLNTLERHRMVLTAIKDLMAGDDAPVHAVDSLKTQTG